MIRTTTELTEAAGVRQVPGEPRRRWFASSDLDLIVWHDESGAPTAFQLCYDKPRSEHALTWTPETGFIHTTVDDGEDVGLALKRTPILVADGHFDADRVSARFVDASANLPPEIVQLVRTRLAQYPGVIRP